MTGLSSLYGNELVTPITGSFKNKIINGDFSVWQRGTSGFTTNGAYTTDRWFLSSDATTATVARTTSGVSPLNGGYLCAMTLTTKGGSFSDFSIMQPIESSISRHYAGKYVTFSVYLVKNATLTAGSVRINIYSSENTDSKTLSTNRVDDYIDIPYSALSSSEWRRFSVTAKIESDKTQLGVLVRMNSGDLPDGSVLWVANAQLEEGTQATDFEKRSFGQELALCQRYYEKSYPYGTAIGSDTSEGISYVEALDSLGTRANVFNSDYKVYKRTPPTVKVYTEGGTVDYISLYSNKTTTVAVSSAAGINNRKLCAYLNIASITETHACHWTADAEL